MKLLAARKNARTSVAGLVALVLALATSWANAAITVSGDLAGKPGDIVAFSIVVTGGSVIESIDIVPPYDGLAPVLTFLDLRDTDGLAGGSGACLGGGCAFFYLPSKEFAQDTLVATLEFQVTPHAMDFVDEQTSSVPLDLGIMVAGLPVPELQNLSFTVLNIPEPSSMALMAAGIAVLGGACVRRRRREASDAAPGHVS